jgi:hypothetical protein
MSDTVVKHVEDLGAAAFLLMHGYKVIGKEDPCVVMFLIGVKEESEFEQQALDYLSSDYHRFDSCLMSLKKIRQKRHR